MSEDVFWFKRAIEGDSNKWLLLTGYHNSESKFFNFVLTIVDIERDKTLSIDLNASKLENLLENLVEFAGKIRLGELTKKEPTF